MVHHARGKHRSEIDSWHSLRLFLLFRLAIALSLLGIFSLGIEGLDLGSNNPALFKITAWIYFVLCIVKVSFSYSTIISFRNFVVFIVLVDILCFTLFMHSSNGLESGLALLMITSIAASSLLLPGRLSLFFAAVAALAILTEQIFGLWNNFYERPNYMIAAIHGIIFFVVASAAAKLARRAKTSDELVLKKDRDLETLAQLNERIVNEMLTGVLVVGDDGRIRFANKVAWRILGANESQDSTLLSSTSPLVFANLSHWLTKEGGQSIHYYQAASSTSVDFKSRFRRIGTGRQIATVIFLDDLSEQTTELQKIKMASLGRLTANLAHEIRNPLGAISHASQLLNESSENYSDSDKHVIDIINKQAKRMNCLVEDILSLSRKNDLSPTKISLPFWFESKANELAIQYNIQESQMQRITNGEISSVYVDDNNLLHIVENLIQNSILHSGKTLEELQIHFKFGFKAGANYAYIDYRDNGKGVHHSQTSKLFEPFYTTNSAGTGLGLYLIKDLCELNGGFIEYISNDDKDIPWCFRVKLPTTLRD